MSTLRLTTISNQGGTASVPLDTVINGTAKAWVNFNGTGTVAIRRGFNVSSITDNGTGDYTVNFTNAMTDVDYCVSMSGGTSGSNGRICQPVRTAPATTGQRVLFQDGAFNGFDTDYCFVAIFR